MADATATNGEGEEDYLLGILLDNDGTLLSRKKIYYKEETLFSISENLFYLTLFSQMFQIQKLNQDKVK